MASKFRRGQKFKSKNGKEIEIVSVNRSIHGNTSLILIKIDGVQAERPVRTAYLSNMIGAK